MYRLLVAALPSMVFWTVAGGLHAIGINEHVEVSKKTPTLKKLITTQLMVDVLQFVSSLVSMKIYGGVGNVAYTNILLGLISIETVEYFAHRTLHTQTLSFLNHKRHHELHHVHTLGAFYNSVGEIIFTSSFLGLVMVGIFNLSPLEIAICSSIGTFATVLDHTPVYGIQRRHAVHHNDPRRCFAQPFTPFFDWLCGTM